MMSTEDIQIEVWDQKAKTERWRDLLDLWYSFWMLEPINSSIVGAVEGQNKQAIADLLKAMFEYDDTPCVVAWDQQRNRAAGMVYSVTETRTSLPPPDFKDFDFVPETMNKVLCLGAFLGLLQEKGDVLNRYQVDKLWYIQVTSVSADYQRRGLANTMTSRVIEIAKELKYPVISSLSTSAYTQRNKINNYQFEKVIELDYENNYTNFQLMSEEVKKSHTTATVLVKRL